MNNSEKNDRSFASNDVDLRELIKTLWRAKWFVIAFTAVFAVGSITYALVQPDIYRSQVLLAPAEESSSFRIPGQLSSVAALAGVNVGGESSKVGLALEILKSREFLGRFIDKYDLKVPVMASKGWHEGSNQLIYDEEIYDIQQNVWLREPNPPRKPEPSLQEVSEEFLELLSIQENERTGMVTVSVEFYSPYLTEEWTRLLVYEINEEMRKRDVEEAESSISYLETQLTGTALAEAQAMLYSLVEENTKKLMLAKVRKEYVLQTIDPAIVPELKAKPKRALIVILATLFGGVASVFLVLALRLYRNYF